MAVCSDSQSVGTHTCSDGNKLLCVNYSRSGGGKCTTALYLCDKVDSYMQTLHSSSISMLLLVLICADRTKTRNGLGNGSNNKSIEL